MTLFLTFFLHLCTKISRITLKMIANISHYLPITDPTMIFLVVMFLILAAPIVMGKLRIPHIVGMVLAGVLVGKYGLNILERDSSFELFGKVGLYYIMFLAGLEMDIEGLKSNGTRVLIFGLLTFLFPFIITYLASTYIIGYTSTAALLLSSIMASNTLIAYPIICKYGLQKHTSVTLCVGSSMIALTLALIVLAAIVGSFGSGAGLSFWALFLFKIVLFVVGGVFILPRLARWFLRRFSDAVTQYIFVMALLFLSATVSGLIGLEGVFGAFFAGLILNRYIPHVSPLMNRIEFIGNALFIPYFLIGVGMLINVRVLFYGWHTAFVIFCIIFFGTFGKAIAAYLSQRLFRLPLSNGNMMFGLTSAHAAGSIAIVMVGMKLATAPGEYLVDSDMLNGVVIMILFTCVISSVVTDRASRTITLTEGQNMECRRKGDDEKILVALRSGGATDTLVNLALMMHNEKLSRGLIGLNVVYDDENSQHNQSVGKRTLEQATRIASAVDVRMLTQSRLATNISNGITHAFKEYDASEIIMGLHHKKNETDKFWGIFTPNLITSLNRQIILCRCNSPLNTLRRITVAVPSRVEFEQGFYRWIERLARLGENLGCRIVFHGRIESTSLINEYIRNQHPAVRAEYVLMEHWKEFTDLAADLAADHMLVVITARPGTVSYKPVFERLPIELYRHFHDKNLMIIYPDQNGQSPEDMTFTAPQQHAVDSAYSNIINWINKKIETLKKYDRH